MNEETQEKVLCKKILYKLKKDEAYIVKSLIFGETQTRAELFQFFTPGNVTKVPQDVMMYLMAFLLKDFASNAIQVTLCSDEELTGKKAEEEDYEPTYYLQVSMFFDANPKALKKGEPKHESAR